MSGKANLYMLIVCGFLCLGIIASLSAKDIRNSSEFLVRNKRVINREPGGHALPKFTDINYIVSIRHNGRLYCAGAVLSYFTVITAARCVEFHVHQYQVQAGSAYSQRSTNHSVISKAVHYGSASHSYYDAIALIKVDPRLELGPKISTIDLHVEPVLPGTEALVSGWGVYHPTGPSMGQQKLRSIYLPIMNHRGCVACYAGHFNITHKHICTYDERKLCALYDIGTPLVINNFLVGIHIYKGCSPGIRNPDVFLNVQDAEFSVWIRNNILY